MTKYKARRLGDLTTVEARWLDMLKRSYLDVTKPFEVRAACEAIILTPTSGGSNLKNAPNSNKLGYVLHKSPDFKVASPRQGKRSGQFVLIVND